MISYKQTAVIVNVGLQLLKAVNNRQYFNKGHLKIVITNSIVIMINTINNCESIKAYNLLLSFIENITLK